MIRREIWLTESMHDLLVAILIDARDDEPDNVQIRKLLNIAKSAKAHEPVGFDEAVPEGGEPT